MEQLVVALRMILVNTLVMYNQAHVMHWNVEGADFPQYHKFFGKVYEGLFDALDPIAEHIRFLGEKPPTTLPAMLAIASISSDFEENTSFAEMLENFQTNNTSIIETIRDGIKSADEADEPAVSNFLQERLGAHQKLAWMIRSLLA